jgi:predicted Zn finger-like uncharacterized protein
MSIQVTCPECRARFTLADDLAGKKIRCSKCQTVFALEPGRPSKKKAAGTGPPVAAIVAAVIAGVALLSVGIIVVVLAIRSQPRDGFAAGPASGPGPGGPQQVGPLQPDDTGPPMDLPAIDNTPPEDDNLRVVSPLPPSAKGPSDPPAPKDGELGPEARDAAKRATVLIRVTLAEGRGSGTGFFGCAEAPNLVLTNAHVVGMLSPESLPPRKVEVVLHSGEKDEKPLTAKVLTVDRASDLAVLDVGTTTGMPTPLRVKAAASVRELDKVYAFGFPLGEQLGKEITIRPSSVSSLRKRDGVLNRIQFNGALDPGNSGGPILDTSGHVVGVAVSGVVGRTIDFAIPGEHVQAVLYGRIARLGVGQSSRARDKLNVPVTIEMIDPRKQIKEMALEVWTGNPPAATSATRPATHDAPTSQPGDSERQRVRLKYTRGVANGDVMLPALPAGKVYWIQPAWRRGDSENLWASAQVYRPGLPVEPKTVTLRARYSETAPPGRSVHLSMVNRLRTAGDEESEVASITKQVAFRERVKEAGGGVTLLLDYKNAAHRAVVNRTTHPSPMESVVRSNLRNMVAQVQFDASGNITVNRLNTLPGPQYQSLTGFHEPIRLALDGTLLALPNRPVKPLEKWQTERSVGIETPSGNQEKKLILDCTYLGVRNNAGREEAVIRIRGRSADEVGGTTRGMMIVDVATGTIRNVKLNVELDINQLGLNVGGTLQQVKLHTLLAIRLDRALGT